MSIKSEAQNKIKTLIAQYQALNKIDKEQYNEANIRANFIDPLFEVLGWPIHNPLFYNRESYIRGIGFADVALKFNGNAPEPLLFLEAKRFGFIQPLQEVQKKRDQLALPFKLPTMSVDRTKEEQQVINYAYQRGIEWAILTNFERLRLFNARRDTLVLNFESSYEYLDRFDELWALSFAEVTQGSLLSLRSNRERQEVDEEYLRFINEWRLRLGQNILTFPENIALLTHPLTQEVDVYQLRDAVQRILDRFVVVRTAEDRFVIQPNQLNGLLEQHQNVSLYSIPLLEQIRHFFERFNFHHNGALFKPHLCDKLKVSEEILAAIITNLYDARFRAMSADIMGNTYEQYLGQTLIITPHKGVEIASNLETRKEQGSYYTPEYIVHYVVDQTLGRYLYGTANGRPDGKPIQGQKRQKIADIDGSNGHPPLTILDPSSGSGSFLIYVYHVLEKFYQAEIDVLRNEQSVLTQQLNAKGFSPVESQMQLTYYKQRLDELDNYRNQILERHIYAVDLDPQAAELAAVNLMLRAITPRTRLPLILHQNIKIGNSLISGLPIDKQELEQQLRPLAPQLAQLRKLRLTQQGYSSDAPTLTDTQTAIEQLTITINHQLNAPLEANLGAEGIRQYPFNWPVEFPEIFLDENGFLNPQGGFTFVLGNPPYLNLDDTWGKQSHRAAYLAHAYPKLWAGKSDLFYFFIYRGLHLLKPHGFLGFINARYYLEAHYAQNLRQAILDTAKIERIVDFGNYVVFRGVGTKTAITLLQKEPSEEIRLQNQLLTQCVPNSLRGKEKIKQFLADFEQQAYLFPQKQLTSASWIFSEQDTQKLLEQIDRNTALLGDICFIGQGMQTGHNEVFVTNLSAIRQHHLEMPSVRKLIKNQDIKPYILNFRDEYLIYPHTQADITQTPNILKYLKKHQAELEDRAAFKRGDCEWWAFTWPLHKDKYTQPKIITPFIAPENRFALDNTAEYISLTDTMVLFAIPEKTPDLRYLLALLNSKLLNFRYRYIGKKKDHRYEYVENSLAKIPIALPPTPEIEQTIVRLAQKLIDLHLIAHTLLDEFQDYLDGHKVVFRPFYEAYFDHADYREIYLIRVAQIQRHLMGIVTKIQLEQEGNQLFWDITTDQNEFFSLTILEIPHPSFREFLLLSSRLFLAENNRKKVWAKGKLLEATLQTIKLPVLNEARASLNVELAAACIQEIHERVTQRLQHLISPENQPYLNHSFGLLEEAIKNSNQEMDDLVYNIYEITDTSLIL